MFDYTSFHDVFATGALLPYDRKLQQEIEAHRKHADGVLFIDRVLTALGIQKAKLYPPKTETTLRQLHQQVCEASMSTHHKLSLFYYLLLDFDDSGSEDDNNNHEHASSANFASLSGMPTNYQLFMKGLWYMDRREYSRALEYVAHPSLNPDFADDILIALIKQASSSSSSSNNNNNNSNNNNDDPDYSLALSYFHSVRPSLKSPFALQLLFDAMARTSLTEALLYSRTHPPHRREQLFRRWVSSVLDGGSASASGGGGGRDGGQEEEEDHLARRATELAFMPLDRLEEAWFEEYLVSGQGRTLKRAQDTLLIRKIACDRFDELGRFRAGGQWASILEGIRTGTRGSD
ncbi:hypothetical protein E4U41_004071 [Claviceps citrina]|nr:hypothetical protein E4U41_004071 [Claviceps citrina]